MHERAGLCIGIRPLLTPERLARAAPVSELLANLSGERWSGEFPPEVDGVDGVAQLHAAGVSHSVWCKLSRYGGLRRIPDVEARSDEDLLAIGFAWQGRQGHPQGDRALPEPRAAHHGGDLA